PPVHRRRRRAAPTPTTCSRAWESARVNGLGSARKGFCKHETLGEHRRAILDRPAPGDGAAVRRGGGRRRDGPVYFDAEASTASIGTSYPPPSAYVSTPSRTASRMAASASGVWARRTA